MTTGSSGRPLLTRPGRRGFILLAVGVIAVIALLYVVVPGIAGLDETWARLSAGDPVWLLAALLLELLSFASYVVFFRAVFTGPTARIDWPASYRITMAGVVATRLLAVAGAGGIALTAWALRRIGLRGRQVAADMAAFYILLYGVYMTGLVGAGLGLYWGIFPGPAPGGLTLVPAIFTSTVIVGVLAIATLSDDLEELSRGSPRRDPTQAPHARYSSPFRRRSPPASRAASACCARLARGCSGAIGWWAFDVAVLWASLEAFGTAPSVAVIVMAYFVGMLANTLPIPGGIGAVDGGVIAALIGFGVSGGLAIVAVLSYRAIAFWLPIVPGTIAYVQLLRAPARPGSTLSASWAHP